MKRVVVMMVLLAAAASASAEPVVGVGLMRLTDSFHNLDAAYLTAGYRFTSSIANVSLIPEVRIGNGAFNKSNPVYALPGTPSTLPLLINTPVSFQMKRLYGASVRVELDGDRTYAYISPGYIHTRITSSRGYTFNSSHFGWQIGIGTRLVGNLAIEGYLGDYGDNVYGIALRYSP